MSLQLAAKHLASHGRGDDKVLVHMTPREVKSLNELAMAHGGHLTINPKTGLPEAGFLSSLLPMMAGAASTYFTGSPYLGMALAGGVSYSRTGSLAKGLMAGLGAYGGGQLAQGLTSVGASEGATALGNPATAATEAGEAAAREAMAKQASMSANYGMMDPSVSQGLTEAQLQPIRDNAMEQYLANTPKVSPQNALAANQDSMLKGAKSLFSDPTADKFKQLGGGSYSGLAKSGLMAAAPVFTQEPKVNNAPVKGDSDMGPRYKFNRGLAQPFPQASKTGVENTYFPNQGYESVSSENAKSLYGYADGGEVSYQYDPFSQNYTKNPQKGLEAPYSANPSANTGPAAEATATSPSVGSPTGSTIGDIGYAVSNMGMISPVAAAIATAAMDALSSTSPTSVNATNGMDVSSDAAAAASPSSSVDAVNGMDAASDAAAAAAAASAASGDAGDGGDGGGDGGGGDGGGEARGGLSPNFVYHMAAGGDAEENPYRITLDESLEAAYAKAQKKNDTAKMRAIEREMEIRNANKAGMQKGLGGFKGLNAGGSISNAYYNLGSYSDGGRLLRGPGDGVSDSIPAVIGRKQPARLADGEFVVPARIVSELGNGSTDAGARKLYAMMDRVQASRKKTVGKGRVAHNNRADKYLPA